MSRFVNPHITTNPEEALAAAIREISPQQAWSYAIEMHRIQNTPPAYRRYGPAPGDAEIARRLIWC